MTKISKESYLTLLMLFAMSIWGGSWSSAKVLASTASPEVLAFWRFLITFISFVPIMLFYRLPFKINRPAFFYALIGALCMVAYNEFMFGGLKHGMASGGGVVVTTLNPIITFVLAAALFRKKLAGKDLLGLTVGLIGGCFLLEIWAATRENLLLSGNLFFLLSSFSWACLTITSNKSHRHLSPLVFSFYVYGMAAVMDLLLSLRFDMTAPLYKGMPFWGNILYMSVASTTIATTIYFIASTKRGSEKASSFIFTVPFTAVLFAWLFLNEIPNTHTIVGGIIGLTAVYILNSKGFTFGFANGRRGGAQEQYPD